MWWTRPGGRRWAVGAALQAPVAGDGPAAVLGSKQRKPADAAVSRYMLAQQSTPRHRTAGQQKRQHPGLACQQKHMFV